MTKIHNSHIGNIEETSTEKDFGGLKTTDIATLVVIGMAVVALVFGIYFLFFWNHKISSDPAAWGQFGDFIGGTANPILSFITLILLALTLGLQNRQLNISSRELELSRKELELTRQELQRSAQAQELSEKALKAQAESAFLSAKLSGINFLLNYYQAEIKLNQFKPMMQNDPLVKYLEELREKESYLITKVEEIYKQISGGEDGV